MKIKLRTTDGHMIDPRLGRWLTVKKGKVIENPHVRGRGFLGMRSERKTLLYYRGFTRRTEDLLRLAVVRDQIHQARDRWRM